MKLNSTTILNEIKDIELIDTEIYLNGDDDESNPVNVYHSESKQVFFTVERNTTEADPVRVFEMTKPFNELTEDELIEIGEYRGLDGDDEITLSDVFMQGQFTKEITSTYTL
jgi:hypothetical protein